MNRQQFINWLNNPASLDQESLGELYKMVQEYPYFQTARLLYLINLRAAQDYRYDDELKSMAVHIADRSRLNDWINLLEKKELKSKHRLTDTAPNIPTDHRRSRDPYLENIEEKIKESLREIELKKSRLKDLLEEKKALVGDIDGALTETDGLPTSTSRRILPKDELLEEFIRQQKTETEKSAGFFNPDESARKSIEDNNQIISETLARLIAAQGKKERAIEIYQKLMLKNPQKSSYFAAQIEKLRKEL